MLINTLKLSACVALLISLFRGLGSRTLYEIHGRLLKRAYITLNYVESVDKDDLTRYHARVALSDLDVIIKGELSTSKTPGPVVLSGRQE